MIGLNPPFGKNGRLAGIFLEKAIQFRPHHIVLISPPMTAIPANYRLVYEDHDLCCNK